MWITTIWVLHNWTEKLWTVFLFAQKQQIDPFFKRIIMCDEKWVVYKNMAQKDPGEKMDHH